MSLCSSNLYLHSTLFILKLYLSLLTIILPIFTFYSIYIKTLLPIYPFRMHAQFTFYSIYIKTPLYNKMFDSLENLHSTLFILKHNPNICFFPYVSEFTFYSIYIKTRLIFYYLNQIIYLHSTLFILKRPNLRVPLFVKFQFTFYSIYIKTYSLFSFSISFKLFTFYSIYIKTYRR